jgi:putative DNA methylase
MTTYPKRLIEVDLPIKRISAHARHEKSLRHGHISSLHIWWARRPLAACRAVLCASLWPDPADDLCPQTFRDVTAKVLCNFAEQVRTDRQLAELCTESWTRWSRTTSASLRPSNPACWPDMRYALLDFIADFSNWNASTVTAFLEAARLLTHVAHLSLTDSAFRLPAKASLEEIKTLVHDLPRPLVVDPFAGGGAIPLESLRIGADAFASDLNPVAVLLNKVVLEYIPKYGNAEVRMQTAEGEEVTFKGLADAVRYWGNWIRQQAEQELAEFYPKDPDGATPLAYLWARTITCEGPGCGAEVPLMRSLWLAKKSNKLVALRLVPCPRAKRVDFEVIQNAKAKDVGEGTVKRGSATCPVCGYTTPASRVREQFRGRHGGANDARLFCVVTTRPNQQGRFYRLPNDSDVRAARKASLELQRRQDLHSGPLSLVPSEELPYLRSIFNVHLLDVTRWGDLFAGRQALTLVTFTRLVNEAAENLQQREPGDLSTVIATLLALAVDKLAALCSSLSAWSLQAQCPLQIFSRQALGILWDFAEGAPLGESSGSFSTLILGISHALDVLGSDWHEGRVEQVSAASHPLPDDTANAFVSDPPYYDAVPYADLSDFFYVWLKRMIRDRHSDLFRDELSPKNGEIVQLAERNPKYAYKTHEYYEALMTQAMMEGRRVLVPDGIGVIVFAHKSTSGWEAQVQSMIDAGWIITGSWPIDTEYGSRMRAQDSAALASSVHLVCRPREQIDGSLRTGYVGDWRDVLAELPQRIHDWMPRLAQEGVVGADAIFACLGPALEIFSRYDRVEKASGELVTLKEYLEHVWGAVAKEALAIIFADADASGLEEDARLTAMWLWTLSTGGANGNGAHEEEEDTTLDDGEAKGKSANLAGFVLEYDAARKIAQGLGAHLERLGSLVQIKGAQARLLPVAERARHLFGKDKAEAPGRRRREAAQLSFLEVVDQAEDRGAEWLQETVARAGDTVLDRVHQAMLLFAAGRADALKRFVVTEGIGRDGRFWRLAQALSALYPSGSDEKRWVDGVLARKKGLGFQ